MMGRLHATLRNDRGSVTVEAALSMVTLVTVTAAVLGAMATMAAHLSAVQTAGAAARAEAVGVEFTPAQGSVQVASSGGMITVTATVPAVFGDVAATAIAPLEDAP